MLRRKKSPRRIEPTFDAASAKSGAKRTKAAPARRRTSRSPKRARRRGLLRFASRSVYWSLVIGIWLGIAGICLVGYHAAQLPQTSVWAIPDRPPNARIVSVDGELLANRGATGGQAVPLDEISPYVPMAVIAIEDRRFEHHFGIDPLGLARAMTRNIVAGRLVQGGSTLTQQLAKNLFLKPERTIGRKIQEAVLAVWLETRFSKDEILELYLNRVYFGSGATGIDAAARRYFDKPARDLNLFEAATLAGVLKAPSRLSPARDPEAAGERAQLVLAAMRRAGFVSDRETATALTQQASGAKRYLTGSEHYVADMVMARLPALIGDMRTDIVIETTIDKRLQGVAGDEIAVALARDGERLSVGQGALVTLDGDGAIRALVGGREYAASQFNRATDAKRQPGSAFKPFVYLTALEAGRSPGSVRQDAPVRIGKWTPENYDRKYRGPVTLAEALSQSLNTVAAQLVMENGPARVIETARRLGVRSKLAANASIALGTAETTLLELTGAYAALANGGYAVTPYLVRRVTTADGEILYERDPEAAQQVIAARELGMMNSMLREALEAGTGRAARLGDRPAAGKTGTSQSFRDGWFVGYTADLVTGLWFGNDDGSATNRLTGGGLPAQVWKTVMSAAHEDMPVAALPGDFMPEVAALPVRRPDVASGDGQAPVDRRATGTLAPPGEVGGQAPARRTLFDLIFGG